MGERVAYNSLIHNTEKFDKMMEFIWCLYELPDEFNLETGSKHADAAALMLEAAIETYDPELKTASDKEYFFGGLNELLEWEIHAYIFCGIFQLEDMERKGE